MNDVNIEKVYFLPGNLVQLKQDIPNKPTMIVVEKKTMTIKPKDGIKTNFFQGMKCMWFTTNGELIEHVFSTKDLIKIKQ